MTATAPANSIRLRLSVWRRQLPAILRLDLKKNFISRRAFLIYVLAGGPVLLMALLAMYSPSEMANMESREIVFANIYEGLILRTVVFFGCAWIFMNLFRGEVVDRSLHYYFLAPLRRELLVLGKYVSGVVATSVLFGWTTLMSYILAVMAGVGSWFDYLIEGQGFSHASTYLLITTLACMGYGALFMLIGLFFRNPIVPAIVVYAWETINFLLPPLLKKASVIHYLHSLSPVPIPLGPFAMVAEPTEAMVTLPSLLIATGVVLMLATYRIRRTEITYAGE